MTYLLLQTFLLLLSSYFLGAVLACMVKRTFFARRVAVPARAAIPATVIDRGPVVVAEPRPARPARPARPVRVEPRPFDPVQLRIEVFRRPEPHPTPKLIDPSRFERALLGPDPNEGMPRKAILELRPAVLKSPTVSAEKSAAAPGLAPKPAPVVSRPSASPAPAPSIAKIVAQEVAQARRDAPIAPPDAGSRRPADATTAAAAAAVAASKAAAAASVTPVKLEAKPGAAPAPVQAPAAPPVAPPAPQAAESKPAFKVPDPPLTGGDDFQRIRAIDFVTEQKLKSTGVMYFDHIAGWSGADVKRLGQTLDVSNRIEREQWIEQAQILAKGGETYYSRNRAAVLKTATPNTPAPLAQIPQPAAQPSQVASGSKPPEVKASGPVSPQPASSSAPLPPQPSAASLPPSAPVKPQGDAPGDAEASVVSGTSGRSVAEMAHAAAAAIAAASASVTRGLRPIEPISPLSKVDPKISIPAKLSDAIRERAAESKSAPGGDTAPPAAKQAPGGANDLKRIRGIGVLIEKRLNGAGVTRYEHIANWSNADVDRFSQLLEFKGRIERENWIEQARILSNGGHTEFSRRVDRGEVDTTKDV